MNVRANVTKSQPPFRAEHTGSLLRPPDLMARRARPARGEIDQADLTEAEDSAVRDALRLR